MYERILIATDGSKLAQKAEKSAIGLAAATGASLVVLHVLADYPLSFFEGASAVPAQDVARVEGKMRDGGQQVIDRVVTAADLQGVRAHGVLAQSDQVADAVIKMARKHRCDLIVLASHGHSGIRRLLLGSETQKVLTLSTVPVLVLR